MSTKNSSECLGYFSALKYENKIFYDEVFLSKSALLPAFENAPCLGHILGTIQFLKLYSFQYFKMVQYFFYMASSTLNLGTDHSVCA